MRQASLLSAEPQRPAFTLRPYQQGALDAIEGLLEMGARRQLVALPTGTGKTVVFAHLPQALGLRRRMLVLAHRQELLEQAADKIRACNPGLTVGIEQAGRYAGDADVVIASVPTLQRQRLEQMDPAEFDLVVVDEAHHGVAQSYRAIFEHFGCNEPDAARPLLGFTATPTRGDNVGLSAVFDEIAYEMSIRQAIKDGWLSPIAGHRVETATDLSDVKVRAGEFVTRDLAEAVNTIERNEQILAAYRQLVPGRRALAFCADVAHAEALAELFQAAGHPAAAISGKTPKDERAETLRRFAAGRLQVVTNCNVLTEGFDDPGIGAILMARPTKSSLLYTQMLGRGTRLAPCKTDVQVIDFADNSSRHRLASTATLFGLPPEMALEGKQALEVAGQLELYAEQYPWIDTDKIRTLDDLKLATRRIDFFCDTVPAELERWTKYTWAPLAGGGYRLSLPPSEVDGKLRKRQRVTVEPTHLDTWRIVYSDEAGAKVMGEEADLKAAVTRADRAVRLARPKALAVVHSNRAWRSQPASDKQIRLLERLHIPYPEGLTKGQASSILDMQLGGR